MKVAPTTSSLLINPYAAGGEFGQYQMMQKNLKEMTETVAHGYSSEITQRELSNEYQYDRDWMVFKNLCIFVLWRKVALALEGLKGPALMARWSRGLPLTASCLSPLRTCPDSRVVKVLPLTASCLSPLRICPDGRVV